MKIVLDSSVIVKCFLEEIHSVKARTLLQEIGKGKYEAHIPSLACYEVAGVLVQNLSDPNEINTHLSSLFSLIRHYRKLMNH